MEFRIAILCSLFALLSCDGFNDENEKNDLVIMAQSPNKSVGGLAFVIKNRLTQHEPSLKTEVCAIDESDLKKPIEERTLCFGNSKPLKFKEEGIYHIDADKAKQLLAKNAKHQIEIRFKDSYSKSLVHWFCWEHPKIDINDNASETQYFTITVTQINNLSYSCKLERS